ncbi:PREDICTED: uncharacterized protein At3g43530-like [Brassica oleracea var. oleracea]|uniref:uncharacterized protein At3g43530-like n=1 Tax=Brassica oleracea var. oleracea TaxID=109376 RepID=UPI0006A719E8|nr:PREDICTED: uncharacterized protein At3g43530-like [Brassica oleracea var. oleracea]
MWMLLMRTICTPEDDVAWFAVNGVPICYSMREHALISGLDCGDYPPNYEKLGGYKFVDYYFHDRKKITISDVKQKMLSMPPCPDRLKVTVLFFLGRVIRGNPKDAGHLDLFILRMMDDLDACRSFPWGRITFEVAIKEIKHVMNHLKGEVKEACAFPGFIIPLEVLAFECIPDLGKTFRIYSDDASEDCPRMCKSRFTKSSLKGYPLEDIYAAVGDTKVINSVLVPTIGEQIMLARIIDEEREYDRQGSPSDTWNYWLNVKQENIWWKELYELDQAARGVLPKNKDKEKVTFAEGSSSNYGLDSRLQGLEERILEFMGEGFVGLHVTVETKLEALGSRMNHIEKNQRLLRRRAKKMEDRLTFIESKVEPSHGEDMDFRQWDYGTYEEKEKANSEKDKANAEQEAGKEKDNIENTEQEAERKYDEEEGEEKESDDNAQQEGEKEKENSEANEQDKEDSESESETGELKQLKERSRAQADKPWKEIEADEEVVGGKHDEEEGEENEAETSDGEKENSEDDEKVEEKVVESEAEGEDDHAEVEGKEYQEEEVEGKESETRE